MTRCFRSCFPAITRNIVCSAAWRSLPGWRARGARRVPAVREVAVGMGGAGRLHAVVSLHQPRPGDARKAVFAIWAAVNLIKQVVVVDDDIDPWDQAQVEWAMATRMKADRDLVVVPGVRTDRSEPLESGGIDCQACHRCDAARQGPARLDQGAAARAGDAARPRAAAHQQSSAAGRPAVLIFTDGDNDVASAV